MSGHIAEQHWAITMTETVCTAGCTCLFCSRRSDAASNQADHTPTTPRSRPRRHNRRSLPSTNSVMEVLYPSSYLGSPAFPGPPSYIPGESCPSNAEADVGERFHCTPLISSTTTMDGTLLPSSHRDPLIEAPSLTRVPYPVVPARAPPAEPNATVVGLGVDILENAEPPPAYSRFDESRLRLPAAPDMLGPYPHISMLNPPA